MVVSLDSNETTEPLPNGAELPTHPALTNARRIIAYGRVWDDADGITLLGGLHANEVRMLMSGQQMNLKHLYRYAIRNRRIYHTRNLVCIDVRCEDVDMEGGDAK